MNNIIRSPRPEGNFSIISNDIIENTALSYKARGLLISLLAKPDDWVVSFNQLLSAGKEGREALRSAFAELEEAGYVVRVKARDRNGKFRTDTFVYDIPQVEGVAEGNIVGSVNTVGTFSTADGLPQTGNRRRETVDGNPYDIISTIEQELNTKPQQPLEVKLPSEDSEPVVEENRNNEETARNITMKVWKPIARGKTSQSSSSVQATIKQALDNGADPSRIAECILRIIGDGNPILEWSLTKALAEKPKPKFAGGIAADKKNRPEDYHDPDFWSQKTRR